VDLADLVEKVEPSVVQLDVASPAGTATGSGFVVDKQGSIVTNYHVVDGATAGVVVFCDKTTARIVGYLGVWPEKDIAILRVECTPAKLHPIPLAKTLPRKGERVAAFGSPLGFSQSVSEGNVAAVRGKKESEYLGLGRSVTWVQTTAPISSGNSGGPLVNMKAEVVGVNTIVCHGRVGTVVAENLNFAVSAVDVRMVISEAGRRVSALPVPEKPRRGSTSTPELVDLTKDPSGAALLASARKVRVLVTLCGTTATDDLEELAQTSVESAFRGSSLEVDAGSSPVGAALLLDVRVSNASGGPNGVQAIVIQAAMAQRQTLDDGTVRIALTWQDSQKGVVSYYNTARQELKRQLQTLLARLIKSHNPFVQRGSDSSHHQSYGPPGNPIDDKERDENQAAAWVRTARGVPDSRPDMRQSILWQVVREYPHTKAAQEAWRLLGEASIETYTDAIRRDPENSELYYKRACAHCLAGKRDNAVADCTEAVRLDPTNADAYSCRANVYGDDGRLDEAITDYTHVIRLKPTDALAYYNRGMAHGRKNQNDSAIADLTQAIRLDPEHVLAHYFRGTAYALKGKLDEAIGDYTEVIRLAPKHGPAYCDRGVAYGRKGDYDTAIADLSEAIRLNRRDARAWSSRGWAYLNKTDYDKAIADLTEAIRLDPKDARIYYNRGAAYSSTGAYDRAIADFTEAIRLNPKNAAAYCERGAAYADKGEHERGVADLTEAIRLDPKYALAYYFRGTLYARKREYDSAIADYTEVIRLALRPSPAHYQRGVAYSAKGEHEKAIADFREAIRLQPGDAEVYNAAAWLLATCPKDPLRNGAEAIKYATKACEVTGWKKPFFFDTLAAAYAEAGQFDKAVEWQQKALADPKAFPPEEVQNCQRRLELYRAGKPYREK
jgi:tetratricopeptide (TPR) repeat protein/S1-C subfamily serine protease